MKQNNNNKKKKKKKKHNGYIDYLVHLPLFNMPKKKLASW